MAEAAFTESTVRLDRWDLAQAVENLEISIPPKQIIFVLHGIWSRGRWYRFAESVFSETTGEIKIAPLNYGLSGLLEFLFGFRQDKIISLINDQILSCAEEYPQAEMSFMAHSYGSYLIFKLLSIIKFQTKYVVLFGSIAKSAHVLQTRRYCRRVINQCGTRDVFPIAAEALKPWEHEATGTYGLRIPLVSERFFDVGHLGCTSIDHLQRYVVPIFIAGHLPHGPANIQFLSNHAVTAFRISAAFIILATVIAIQALFS